MIKNNDNFLIALSCSIAFHLLIVYFFIFGMPSLFKPLPVEEVITFEMLPVSSISNVPNKKMQKETPLETEEAKKVEKSKVEQPIEEKPKEKEEPQKQEEKPEAEVVEKKKEEKPKPKEEPKKIEKPKEQKKKPISNTELDSLLKNLEKESEGTKEKSNKKVATQSGEVNEKESKGTYNEDLPLSISEKNLLENQIARNWNNPIGSENVDQVKITLYIRLDKDGSVLEASIKNKECGLASNVLCQLVADSTIRAVKQASPIQGLPIERYDSWKKFNFLFDPSKMVR